VGVGGNVIHGSAANARVETSIARANKTLRIRAFGGLVIYSPHIDGGFPAAVRSMTGTARGSILDGGTA
jgi:hypothetical protein